MNHKVHRGHKGREKKSEQAPTLVFSLFLCAFVVDLIRYLGLTKGGLLMSVVSEYCQDNNEEMNHKVHRGHKGREKKSDIYPSRLFLCAFVPLCLCAFVPLCFIRLNPLWYKDNLEE